jgi:GTPase SAR1 family protein
VERRLREFVDRDAEMAQYRALLDSDEKLVMVVSGSTGMGKTSLLLRMIHECAVRKVSKAEVMWNDTNALDYMATARKIRDDLGVEHFKAFTDLINYFTDAEYQPKLEVTLNVQAAGKIEVASNMRVGQSTVGDIAGVVIRDNMFVVQRPDLAIAPEVRRNYLTQRFLEGLAAASASTLVVLFFDTIEKMSDITHKWLWEQVLEGMRSGLLKNVRAVLCGQRPPPDDRDWAMFVETAELKPLGLKDIEAYLERRAPAIGADVRRELAKIVLVPTGGRPTDVAAAVDAYLKLGSG